MLDGPLLPTVVRDLLSGVPPPQKQPSRFLLLQAHDACYATSGWRAKQAHAPSTTCALELLYPAVNLSAASRLEAMLTVYRSLTGDTKTPDEALATEAMSVARKRDHANRQPSAG